MSSIPERARKVMGSITPYLGIWTTSTFEFSNFENLIGALAVPLGNLQTFLEECFPPWIPVYPFSDSKYSHFYLL